MPHSKVLRLILLTLAGVLVPFVKTEYPQGPFRRCGMIPGAAVRWRSLETTPSPRFSDSPGFPPYTSDYEPEDTTHLHQLDNGNGSLGPGAIGAIVIAALLGTSVIVALIVITLRKFSAS